MTVNGDTVFEGDEAATLTVALAAGEDNAVGDPQTGTLTIHNDDAAPTLTLNTGESGTEGTEMAVIAKANGVSQAAMTFTVTFSGDSTNGNTAASADDYVDSSIQGIIPAGTAASTPITWGTFRLANDHIDEPAETIKALAHDVGNHVDDVSAFYKINDDVNDRPPSVSVSDVTVDEGAGDADVAVNLGWDAGNDATSTTRPVVVDYMTVNGTAVAPSDYGAVTSDSITIAAGEASGTISVPIADDNRNEPDETFGAKITSVSPTEAAIARGTGTVTITDNDQDAERPTFAVENIAKAEDAAGTADFTVTLSGVAADDVDFNVYMSDGTAVDTGSGAGSNDYNAPIAALTIPVGQTVGTVSVTVNPDTVYEGDENATLHVALTDTERDATGVPKTPTLTITDDDPVPAIALNTASGSEGDDVSVIATVTGITQRDVTYDLGYSGDTTGSNNAAEPADYDGSEVTAVVPGGTATGAKVNFGAIKLAADHVDEPVEVIKVAQRTTGNAVGASTIYKINDDLLDLPPTISIGDAEVGEGDGNAEVPVSLAFGAPGNDATSAERDTVVSYSTANGTATAGLDYTVVTDSVTIGAGQLSGVIRVPVINDTRDEPAETFTVRTTAHTPTEATVGRGTGTVTITDNDADAPRPSFSVEDVSKVENSAGPAEFTVTLSGVAQGDVDFNVYMSDGSAVDTGSGVGSNDYNAPLAALTIPTGQTVGTVSVTVNGDAVYEGAESAALHVALADGERDASGIPMTPSLTIIDDDPVPTIALNTASGGEGDDVSVIATVTGVTQRDVTYDLEYSGDTTGSNNAAEPADYDSSEVTAVIPGGTVTGAKVNFGSIKLGADHVDEPVEVIRVAQHTTGDTVGVSTIYKINDDVNDQPPSVSIADWSVGEGDENADVPVDLVWADGNDAIATERDTVVNYATANGTAVAPADYTASTTGSITIAAVDESGTISVPIVDDTRDENSEAFTVRVTSHTPTEATVSRSTGTVTITDNDAEAPRPSFSVDDVSKVENSAGTANFTVELSGVAQGDVSFTVGMGATEDTAVDVGAGAGSNDYNPPLTAFTIPEGQTTVTVPVTVNGDAIYEADETATLTVALADGERDAAGDPVNPTLTIENDDTKPTMTLKTAFGYEGVDLSVSAIVAGTAQDDVSYDLSFAGDGSGTNNAAEDDDFDASGVAAVIPAGTASGAQVNLGSISLADDTVDEPTETIRAVAHDPDADSTAGDRTSSYRIFDDPDDLPPSVAIGDVTVGEADETAEVPVSLTFGGDTTATEQDVTVAFTMSNGTARTGLDYTGRSASLRIAAGETEGAVSVAITDDNLFEDDQDFTVKLGSATPNGVVVDSAVGTVTIAENDEATAPTLTAPTTIEGMGYVIMTGRAGEGATVQLLMAPGSSGGSFTAAATTVADSSGNFSFRRYFDIGYRVQARAHDLTSPPRAVAMRQLPALTGGSTVRGAVTLTVTGNPRSAGQAVQIQRANTGGTWTTVATGALTSAGTFSANVRGLTSGAFYTFRAVIPATPAKGILAGTSATRRIGVR